MQTTFISFSKSSLIKRENLWDYLNQYLLFQSHKWKHQNNMGNLFEDNNKDTRMA